VLGEQVCMLLGFEHHLLISPLGVLCIRVRNMGREGGFDPAEMGRLDTAGWALVKGGGWIERLGVGVPSGLLLLDRV